MAEKVCVGCAQPVSRTGTRGPWPSRCPPCKVAHEKDYQREHHVRYNRGNPAQLERRRAYQREWQRAKGQEARRAEKRLKRYGLTPGRFEEMLRSQSGACVFCLAPFDMANQRDIHVDHDHSCCATEVTCGQCVRFLLCRSCNAGLGHFKENPSALRRAADALEGRF